jgi:hypothetical protein
MSTSENTRAALLVLSQQLTQLTYGETHPRANGFMIFQDRAWKLFVANFELILEAINSLTHDHFSSTVKKTMIVSQLRGHARDTIFEYGEDWNELDYEEFLDFVGGLGSKGRVLG